MQNMIAEVYAHNTNQLWYMSDNEFNNLKPIATSKIESVLREYNLEDKGDFARHFYILALLENGLYVTGYCMNSYPYSDDDNKEPSNIQNITEGKLFSSEEEARRDLEAR
jgi:hypothetical protein